MCGESATRREIQYRCQPQRMQLAPNSRIVRVLGVGAVRTRFGLMFVGSLALGGCSLFPASGPESWDIKAGHSETLPYAVVKITPQVNAVLANLLPRLTKFAEERRPQDIRLG